MHIYIKVYIYFDGEMKCNIFKENTWQNYLVRLKDIGSNL